MSHNRAGAGLGSSSLSERDLDGGELSHPCRGFIWLVAAGLGWCGLWVLIVAMLKASGLVRYALASFGL
jgi:hypothetical protein